jgi:hypothetical protein
MRALKMIVATAVIVFALTTVAMAGVQRIGSQGDTAMTAAGPSAAQTHQVAGVTLTDDQFAQLLRTVNGQGVNLHIKHTDRETTRVRVHDHGGQKTSDSAVHVQAQQRTEGQNASSETHDSGGTPVGGTQHDGGTGHDGVMHHDGGTQDSGTHHDGGTCGD